MQVIQTIRDKGAAVVIAVIALSLIGFLLMDAKSGSKGGGGFLGSLSSNVGKVNGEVIEKTEFDKKVNAAYELAKEQAEQQQYTPDVPARAYAVTERKHQSPTHCANVCTD